MKRFAPLALWTAYGLLVVLVAIQLWSMQRAVDQIRELECNLAIVSLVENDVGTDQTAAAIEVLNEVCADYTTILGTP